MTSTWKLEASFSDLAAACRLDYQEMEEGKIIYDIEVLQKEEVQGLHYQAASDYGPSGGMRRIPKVMVKLLSRTIVPEIDDDDSELEWSVYEFIMAIKSGERLNIVKWMVSEMMTNRRDADSPLIFQPYIMALVLRKVPDFKGLLETET